MKLFAVVCFFGFTQGAVVKRDAEPDNLGLGYGAGFVSGGVTGVSPAQVSQPVCNSVPEKVCKDRSVETPRKVCHTEHDEIIDTTITEQCEERVTTKCEQVSSQTRHSQAIIGSDSKVVAKGIVASGESTVAVGPSTATGAVTGYGAGGAVATGGVIGSTGIASTGGLAVGSGYADGYGYGGLASTYSGYKKRDADADAGFTAGIVAANTGVSPVSTSAPICRSVPVRHCNQVPVNRPRKVARTVCKTVVDIKIIKDCTDTVRTTCTQQSVQHSKSSAVVGTNSRDGPYAVVAEHGTVSVGASSTPIGAAPIGGYTSGGILGGSTIIGGGATIGATAPIAGGYIGGTTGLASPVISGAVASAPIVTSAPISAAAPNAAAPAPAVNAGGAEALALAKAGLVSHPNGAVVPVEPADVAAARAEHLAAVAAA